MQEKNAANGNSCSGHDLTAATLLSRRTTGNCQSRPSLINFLLSRFIHPDLIRPGAREAFAGPLVRGVNAHLGAEVRQARGVFELIDGTQRELNIPLGIDMVEGLPYHFPDVVHVYVVIHYHDALGEHGTWQTPDGVHHFARVAG